MEIAKNISLAIVTGVLIYIAIMFGKMAIVGFIGLASIYIIAKIVKGYKTLSTKWKDFRNKDKK